MKSSASHRYLPSLALCACFLAGMACARGAVASSASPAANATVTFRKVFKSSYPEYGEIKVTDTGAGTFDIRQLNEESNPRTLHLEASLVQTIFELAAKLHNFDGVDLEIHRRIGNLGEKTFGYDRGGESHTVSVNYTLNHEALQLLTIFEWLARPHTYR